MNNYTGYQNSSLMLITDIDDDKKSKDILKSKLFNMESQYNDEIEIDEMSLEGK